MDIGAELRRARVARRLSIEDVARVTKISPSVLRAIEQEDFARVPGGLFTRGFLRSYAREVGLDGEIIVQHYRAAYDIPEITPSSEDVALSVSDELDDTSRMNEEPGGSRQSQLIQVGIILLVMLVYFSSWRQPKSSMSAEVPATSAIGVTSPVEVPVPVATSGSTDTLPAQLKLEIRPEGQCWVRVTADGDVIVSRLMAAGERQTIDVREEVTLRIGDPAAFAFSINGVAGHPVGPAGTPVTIRINPRNYETFLVSPAAADPQVPSRT
jgi:cytoskeletal protein RodZ